MAYTTAQINRIGNTLVFFTEKLGKIAKTKILKLLYILEEESVKKGGSPFSELTYTYLPKGPVATFIKNQIDKKREPVINFVDIQEIGKGIFISAKKPFDNDEFSDFDIELMNYVVENFGKKDVEELINYTHRDHSPWKNLENKFNGKVPSSERTLDLMDVLNSESTSSETRKFLKAEQAFNKIFLG
jgi:uncharacterized phage-associated protein